MLSFFLKIRISGTCFAMEFSLKGERLNRASSIWLVTGHHGKGKSGLSTWHHAFRYQACPLCAWTTQGRCISETKEAFSHVPVLSFAPAVALCSDAIESSKLQNTFSVSVFLPQFCFVSF